MRHEQYEKLAQAILPQVARVAPVRRDELRLDRPGQDGDHAWATVYWQSMYVCKAEIHGQTLTLSDWRPLWADRGRLEIDLDPVAPAEWQAELDRADELGLDTDDYAAAAGAPYHEETEESAHQRFQEIRLEGEAQAMADYWGEDLYGPRGTHR